jgi:hypothetical protein
MMTKPEVNPIDSADSSHFAVLNSLSLQITQHCFGVNMIHLVAYTDHNTQPPGAQWRSIRAAKAGRISSHPGYT